MSARYAGDGTSRSIPELLRGQRVLCTSSSSYQLFTLLSIFGSEKNRTFERCDLLLPSLMPDVDRRREEAKRSGAFDEVFVLEMDYEKSPHPLRAYLKASCFHGVRYRNEFLGHLSAPFTSGYDLFLYPGYVPISIDSKAYIASSAVSYIYEEGTGTYNGLEYDTYLCGDDISRGQFSTDGFGAWEFRKRLLKFLFSKRGKLDPEGQLVFRPELLPDWLSRRLQPYRIDLPESGEAYHSLMPEELDLKILKRTRVVFLTLSDDSPQNTLKMEEDIIGWLHDRLGDALVVKPHPGRSNLSPFSSRSCVVLPKSTPWEALIASKPFPESCFLAGICSSAQMTPNTVFGLEPNLLFLANLVDLPTSRRKAVETTIGMIRSTYSHKDRILVPASLEELSYALSNQ